MKKILYLLITLLSFSTSGFAQQYINIYKDAVVIKQLSTEEIDSISVTETEPHIVSFWFDGQTFLTYNSVEIDSITVVNRRGAPLSYLGIVGFNDQLYTKNIGILSPSTVSQYRSFVNNLSVKYGTLLYYAVDSTFNMIDSVTISSPLKSVNVVTFTDGLDQGSLMKTDKYNSSMDYLNALNRRIEETEFNGLPVNAYTLGMRGNDITDPTLFQQNLQKLVSSPENVFEVSSISGLRSKLQEIANQIIGMSTRLTISVRVPGVENGTRMRFVFDGKPAANSELYIEGTFRIQDRCLHDVTYQGIKAVSGKTIQGTQDGIFVTYTFTGLRREVGNEPIPTSSVSHYYKYPSATSWQSNSEFHTQKKISHSGTSVMLVLDCSSSLGNDFGHVQQYANEFIDLIAINAEPFDFSPPTNVKAVLDENDLVVNIFWDAVKYAQYYNVYRSSSDDTYELVAENVTSNSWTDNSPLKGNNYYKITAVGYGFSAQSSSTSVNIKLKLDTPTNVRASIDANDLVVNVSWDAVKYAQCYNVYRSSSAYGTYSLVAEGVTVTAWTDNSPLKGNNYYKVSAVNRNITSAQSSSTSVNVKLDAPTNTKAELGVKNNQLVVNISWDAVKYAQYYNVYRSSSDDSYELVAENVTSNSWTDNSPLKGNNYYKITAVGYGFSAQSSSTSVNVKLDAPTNVRASIDANDLVVNISWDAVKYAQYYNVYRCSSDNSYELVAENVTSNSWTDNNPYLLTYYKVSAASKGIESELSSAICVVVEYVDLNLPSGTLWATRNIGANSPEDLGDFFAWGEIESGKTNFSWSTYKWCNGSATSLTKYCTNSDYGILDNKEELDLEDDAAYINWGSEWRMPSQDQFEELIDSKYTTLKCISLNGVYGVLITSKKNGNSIFLPNKGDSGRFKYWSRSLGMLSHLYAGTSANLYLGWEQPSGEIYGVLTEISDRYRGLCIRPVRR